MNFKTLTGMMWDQVIERLNVELPEGAYQNVPGGARLTGIKPSFLVQALTECFGPYGVGWGLERSEQPEWFVKEERKTAQGGMWKPWCVGYLYAIFWYKIEWHNEDATGEPPKVKRIEIETSGYAENEHQGWAMSGAKTSAIGEAAKYLLWQFKVYSGQYKAPMPNENIDWSKPGLIKVTFGKKHPGKTMIEILKAEDGNYLEWLARESSDAIIKKGASLTLALNADWETVFQSGVDYFGFESVEKVKEIVKTEFGTKGNAKDCFTFLMNYEHK